MTPTVVLYGLAGWIVLSIGVAFVFGRALTSIASDAHEWDAWLDLRTPQRDRTPHELEKV